MIFICLEIFLFLLCLPSFPLHGTWDVKITATFYLVICDFKTVATFYLVVCDVETIATFYLVILYFCDSYVGSCR